MLYGTKPIDSIEKIGNSNELLEAFLVDDVIRQSSDNIKKFCESEEARILEAKNMLKKPTLMRLSKQDDFNRRVKLVAYQLAKEANDPNFAKLKKYTSLRKECIAKIMQKYSTKAEKIAKVAQKNYMKTASKISDSKKDDDKK
jgi:hypothetical protein